MSQWLALVKSHPHPDTSSPSPLSLQLGLKPEAPADPRSECRAFPSNAEVPEAQQKAVEKSEGQNPLATRFSLHEKQLATGKRREG